MRLVVVSGKKTADALVESFIKSGYEADAIYDGKKALDALSSGYMDYDFIILDFTLPRVDGEMLCSMLRQKEVIVPILVLLAKDELENKVDLLFAGADDYLVRPFSFDDLMLKIKTILHKPISIVSEIIKRGDIEIHPSGNRVIKNGRTIPLTTKEFTLLEHFMKNPNKVISRAELLAHLWDSNYASFSNVIDVHIKNLRRKLNWVDGNNVLETVRGVGYVLR
jgi:DNA-binding response OmpR family regulator